MRWWHSILCSGIRKNPVTFFNRVIKCNVSYRQQAKPGTKCPSIPLTYSLLRGTCIFKRRQTARPITAKVVERNPIAIFNVDKSMRNVHTICIFLSYFLLTPYSAPHRTLQGISVFCRHAIIKRQVTQQLKNCAIMVWSNIWRANVTLQLIIGFVNIYGLLRQCYLKMIEKPAS